MALELTFLPAIAKRYACSHALLPIGADYDLNRKIQKLFTEVGKVSDIALTCYVARNKEQESCYGDITEDCYGKPIGHVFAKDLKTLNIGIDRSPRQIAAFEYIKCLDDDLEIYLYWH